MITNNNHIEEWSMLIDPVMDMLLTECETNKHLQDCMRREDKNLEDMAKYIYGKVREISSGKKCVCIADHKIMEMAIEYFTTENEENDEQDAE